MAEDHEPDVWQRLRLEAEKASAAMLKFSEAFDAAFHGEKEIHPPAPPRTRRGEKNRMEAVGIMLNIVSTDELKQQLRRIAPGLFETDAQVRDRAERHCGLLVMELMRRGIPPEEWERIKAEVQRDNGL